VCDDPIKPDEALRVTGLQLEEVSRIWKNTAATRRMDPARHASVIIMQRLAEDDLAGEMLREQGYEHLCLPMRYVPGCTWDFGCSLGKLDQRTEAGELLAPQRFPESAVQELEAALETEQNVGAQLQQNPVPKRGAFFEDDWFGTWEALPARPRYVQSWDLGFKGKRAGKQQRQAHSRVHGALWAFTDAAYYLVAEVIGWWNYPETRRQFQRCQTLWAKCEAVLVEDKANGPALIDEMAELSPGVPIKPVEPQGSKEDRASRHSALAESGKILLPTAEQMPTIGEFRAELVRFPNQRRNDRVDTTTQALDYMTDKAQRLRAALHAIGKNR
jgi:predicted phage terminase large subunit-like protein